MLHGISKIKETNKQKKAHLCKLLLEFLICIIYAKLFEAVDLEHLESVQKNDK